MKYLFLHILCTVLLFLIFRFLRNFKVNSFHAVVINYLVCIGIGIIFIENKATIFSLPYSEYWLGWAIFTGALFVPTFYLMGLTVEKVNVSVATVANKMSLIIPVGFSLIYLQKGVDHFSYLNLSGIFLGITSIFLTSYKPEKMHDQKRTIQLILLPASIFLLGGLIDTLINYTNFTYLHGEWKLLYPLILFATAGASGIIALAAKLILNKELLSWKDVAGGILLGIPNYFSLFFLMKTLSDFNNDGAVVFPVVNIGVIVIASLFSVVLFREKLSGMNLAGICLSSISVILVFW